MVIHTWKLLLEDIKWSIMYSCSNRSNGTRHLGKLYNEWQL